MWTAAIRLGETSLLRTLDRETSRFTLHMALCDIVLADLQPKTRRAIGRGAGECLLRRLEAWREDRRK